MTSGRKHEQIEAIRAISAGDAKAMSRLYATTSRQLYGKLISLLDDPNLAAAALKATYVKVWQNRQMFGKSEGKEFQLMAAMAHQCALEIRFKRDQTSGALPVTPPSSHSMAEGLRGSQRGMFEKRDEALLKAAYLQFESPEALAQRFGITPGDVRSRLAVLSRGKGGRRDE